MGYQFLLPMVLRWRASHAKTLLVMIFTPAIFWRYIRIVKTESLILLIVAIEKKRLQVQFASTVYKCKYSVQVRLQVQ